MLGHVRQTDLLPGKVPGGWFEGFWGRLLLTSKSFRFFARLKAFSGGLLKILAVVLSSWRIRKFLKMMLTATRFLGWNVVANGTSSIAALFATTLFKISTLDLVDARDSTWHFRKMHSVETSHSREIRVSGSILPSQKNCDWWFRWLVQTWEITTLLRNSECTYLMATFATENTSSSPRKKRTFCHELYPVKVC